MGTVACGRQHLARCGNCVSGVRSSDLILVEIREPGREATKEEEEERERIYMERRRVKEKLLALRHRQSKSLRTPPLFSNCNSN